MPESRKVPGNEISRFQIDDWISKIGTLAQLVQSAALTEQRSLVRAQYVPPLKSYFISRLTFINNSFVTEEKASLLVNDLSIQRGYGVFDFFRTINGRYIHLDDHLLRFFHSAARMRLELKFTKEGLKEVLDELVTQNNIQESGIRITLTGGYSPDGMTILEPNLVITQKPLAIEEDIPGGGIKLVSYAHQRQLPDIKTIDYLMAIWLKPFVTENGADDLLYHNGGIVTESPRSNFFIVTRDDKVVTPATNILHGINRKYVNRIAGDVAGFEERDISLKEVYEAKEAFLTSTTKVVLPVTAVDKRIIGTGTAGKTTLLVREKLKQVILQHA